MVYVPRAARQCGRNLLLYSNPEAVSNGRKLLVVRDFHLKLNRYPAALIFLLIFLLLS